MNPVDRWWRWAGRVGDWGFVLTIALCLLIIGASFAAVGWRLAGHGPIFPIGDRQEQPGDQRVTDQTVAPAVTYQAEEVDP